MKEILIAILETINENPAKGLLPVTPYRRFKMRVIAELIESSAEFQGEFLAWCVRVRAQKHTRIEIPTTWQDSRLYELLNNAEGTHRRNAQDGGGHLGRLCSEFARAWRTQEMYDENEMIIHIAAVLSHSSLPAPWNVVREFLAWYAGLPETETQKQEVEE